MPKRKRPMNPDRPPPPPPPPKSLVNLLKSDKKVLQYFTLLQANLEADKQKWKGRASDYQKECEELKKNLADRTGNEHTVKSNVKKSDKKPAPTSKKKPQVDISASRKDPAVINEAIDDDMFDTMFDGLSSSDEGDDFNVSFDSTAKSSAKETPVAHNSNNDDDDDQFNINFNPENPTAQETPASNHPFHDVLQERLREVHANLAELGVALVDDEGVRRPDEDVLADFLHTLRAVTRVQSRHNKDLAPFLDMIPACDRKDHPAYKAKHCAFTALRLMDMFSVEMQRDEWDSLARDDHCLTGLRNRQSLVVNLMRSLGGEVSISWPVADRSSRIVTTALHYDPSDTNVISDDITVSDKSEFGAKSQARLSTIVERSLLVQLLVHYHDHRGEPEERILLLIRYVISTAPSLTFEDYPKYPPVMSTCIIEAMLMHGSELVSDGKGVFNDVDQGYVEALRGAALAVHVVALIWKERLKSNDDRINDIARVQLASYERILKLNLHWFGKPLACNSLDEIEDICKKHGAYDDATGASILAITHEAGIQRLKEGKMITLSSPGALTHAVAHSVARRQLEILQLDRYRSRIGTPSEPDAFKSQLEFLDLLEKMEESAQQGSMEIFWEYVYALGQCCLNLSDGNRAIKLAQLLLTSTQPTAANRLAHRAFLSIAQLSQTPLVRFINLKKRVDRRNAFQSQAKIEKLFIVDGIVDFEAENGDASYYWGDHAFDGTSTTILNESRIYDYVATHWRPSDLKAFDRDAPVDDNLVKTSPSERACALSHISAWEGVRRSLQPISTFESSGSVRHPSHILRLFRTSGFASGKALLAKNKDMPPTPVCVIMEDDAILVDRFTERLENLLQELPRDFHFCSLGYSRPKTAPVVPYSSQVGIPSCIWYLTGYVLSLEGASHLKRKLPVRGPVDSWIGMQMCANWENEYGQNIGVGMQSRPATAPPSRKDLEQIMKFRAFCALTPLCSQRINASATATVRRSWRQRDTDIVYSGH